MPHRGDEDGRNVVLNEMNQPFAGYALSPAEMEKWALVEDLRDDVNVVLENARNEKKIGKALEAHVVLYPQGDEGKRAMEKLSAFTTDQLADLFIVSDVEIAQGAGAAGVKGSPASRPRCLRPRARSVSAAGSTTSRWAPTRSTPRCALGAPK